MNLRGVEAKAGDRAVISHLPVGIQTHHGDLLLVLFLFPASVPHLTMDKHLPPGTHAILC